MDSCFIYSSLYEAAKFVPRRLAVESRFNVKIKMPSLDLQANFGSNLVIIEISGPKEGRGPAAAYIETFVKPKIVRFVQYPRQLREVLGSTVWQWFFETTNEVVVKCQPGNMTLIISGQIALPVANAISAINSLILSLQEPSNNRNGSAPDLAVLDRPEVPKAIAKNLRSLTTLPSGTIKKLLSWVKEEFVRNTDGDSVICLDNTFDTSIEVLDVKQPPKEPAPVIVISDDEDNDDGRNSRPVKRQRTENRPVQPGSNQPSVPFFVPLSPISEIPQHRETRLPSDILTSAGGVLLGVLSSDTHVTSSTPLQPNTKSKKRLRQNSGKRGVGESQAKKPAVEQSRTAQNANVGSKTVQNAATGRRGTQNAASGTRAAQKVASGIKTTRNMASGTKPAQKVASGARATQNVAGGTRAAQKVASGNKTARNVASGIKTARNVASGTKATHNGASGTKTTRNATAGAKASKNAPGGSNATQRRASQHASGKKRKKKHKSPRGINNLVNNFIAVSSSEDETSPPTIPQPVIRRRLRPVVIDGSNVAYSHGKGKVFSSRGILLTIQYFLRRGHTDVTAFVPRHRLNALNEENLDIHILKELADKQQVVFTPSRSYDDRFIVRLAHEKQGVILSNDSFRDIIDENEDWKKVIQERLLMYCFVGDLIMIPDDPHGRRGPNLDDFLSFPDT